MKLIKTKINPSDDDFYYSVGGQKEYSRLQAMKKGQTLCKTLDTNELWSNVEFVAPFYVSGEEPDTDILELYYERARQLRKDYGYLRLWITGGADSSHVAQVFYAAGITPDEIAYYNIYSADLTSVLPDVTYGLVPYLNTYKEWWPAVKLTEYPFFVEDFDEYRTSGNIEHFISHKVLGPAAVSLHQVFETHYDLLIKDNKTADIYSGPDIVIGRDSTGWYYRFLDLNTNLSLQVPDLKYFFFSPEFPELGLKIIHLFKKHYENIKIDDSNIPIGEWYVQLSDLDSLKFYPGFRKQFSTKTLKKAYAGEALLNSGGMIKFVQQNSSFFKSVLGFRFFMEVLAYYNELDKKYPHWFNNDTIAAGWKGMKSRKVYFEK